MENYGYMTFINVGSRIRHASALMRLTIHMTIAALGATTRVRHGCVEVTISELSGISL